MWMMSKKLACPCGACQGKLVTSYIRRQHMKLFVEDDTVRSKISVAGSSVDSSGMPAVTSHSTSPGLHKVSDLSVAK